MCVPVYVHVCVCTYMCLMKNGSVLTSDNQYLVIQVICILSRHICWGRNTLLTDTEGTNPKAISQLSMSVTMHLSKM